MPRAAAEPVGAGDPRIVALTLDEGSFTRRSDDIEQEKRVALHDLLAENRFAPLRAYPGGYRGPYRVELGCLEGRLAIDIMTEAGERLELLLLSLSPLRRAIKDYFAICDSYFQAVRGATAQQIETIDMARRGIHNGAADLLVERLAGKVELDFDTARRLFTLICVLQMRG